MLEIEYPLDRRAPECRFISMVLTTLDNGQLAALSLRVGRDELVDSELDKRGIKYPKKLLGNYYYEDCLETLLEIMTEEQMEQFILTEQNLPERVYSLRQSLYFKVE